DKDSQAKSKARSRFWGAHQRFFNGVLTAMQMPSVLDRMDKDLADGHALVVQLVNTNEAQQERRVAEAETDDDLNDMDLSSKDVLIQMVERGFPVAAYETYIDENGNER